MTQHIACISLKGGTGRTTVAANLATTLAGRGHEVMVYDLDPQNALGLHFGMAPDETTGISRAKVSRREVKSYTVRTHSPVLHLPFGRCTHGRLRELEHGLESNRGWIARKMEELTPGSTDFVIMDVPAGRNPWAQQALEVADLALVVLSPCAASYASIPTTEAYLSGIQADASRFDYRYLVNQMDSGFRLSRDVFMSMQDVLEDRLLSTCVHYDESVREALAQQQIVADHAPYSQVQNDLMALAGWTEEHFTDMPIDAPPRPSVRLSEALGLA